MATKSGDPGKGKDRKLKLSAVETRKRTLKDAYISCRFDRYWAQSTTKAVSIFEKVGVAHNEGQRFTNLLLAESTKVVGDLIAVPTAEESPDHAKINWSDQGRTAEVDVDHILALRKVKIPEGTRMYIDVYEDEDPDFGKVIGLKMNTASFEPIKRREPSDDEEGQTDPNKAADKQNEKGTAGKAKSKDKPAPGSATPTPTPTPAAGAGDAGKTK